MVCACAQVLLVCTCQLMQTVCSATVGCISEKCLPSNEVIDFKRDRIYMWINCTAQAYKAFSNYRQTLAWVTMGQRELGQTWSPGKHPDFPRTELDTISWVQNITRKHKALVKAEVCHFIIAKNNIDRFPCHLPLVGQTDSSGAPNIHHCLSQCCYARVLKKKHQCFLPKSQCLDFQGINLQMPHFWPSPHLKLGHKLF